MYNRKESFSSYYQRIKDQVRSEILRESEEQIIGSDPDELAQFFYEKYAIENIEEDEEIGVSWEIDNYLKTIFANEREDFYRSSGDLRDFQCQKVSVEIPILHNKDTQLIAGLQSSTHWMGLPEENLIWGPGKIILTIETKGYGFQYDSDKIKKEIENGISNIRSLIQWKNSDISSGNSDLLSYIKGLISSQKTKITQDKEKIAELTKKIDIPLKPKKDALNTFVRVNQKPIVQRIKPKPSLPEEYVLDKSKVIEIINFLDGQAKTYEQTPQAVRELDEESLRDLILANLNSVFEGGATGETFSKKGKTDIYLRIDKGNILICECKIWGGSKLYSETIDQLRGYLTWRHNYGIMITFVRLKDFTKAMREAEESIQAHNSYIGGLRKISDTHFVSNHRVDDDEKSVEIHHLFYNLYSSSKK